VRYGLCLVLVWGCDSVGDFQCNALKTCNPGHCEATGFCSFDDPTCTSGRRYGDYAGNGLAGTCVGSFQMPDAAPMPPDGNNLPDGATPDAPAMYNPPWWDPTYKKRQQLTVTAPAAVPSGFQLGWPLDVEALIGTGNWDQIRIVRYTSSWQEMVRVLDANGTDREWSWIKLAAPIAANGTDTTYWLYYDNASPGSAMNDPGLVFDFYDPFASSTIGAAWSTQGNVSLTGELLLHGGASVHSVAHYNVGQAVDWTIRMPTFDFRFWCGFQIDNGTTGFNDDAPWLIWIARGPNLFIWPEYNDAAAVNFTGANVQFDTTAFHIYGVERLADRVVYRYDDLEAQEYMMPPVSTALVARMANETANPIHSNMMRIRKSVHPYPMVTLGPLETHP
jgi:hypothetical protein